MTSGNDRSARPHGTRDGRNRPATSDSSVARRRAAGGGAAGEHPPASTVRGARTTRRASDTRGVPGVPVTSHGGRLSRSTLWDDGDPPPGPQPLRARWAPVPDPGGAPPARKERPQRRRSALGWFVHHYGWRAYALPVLAAVTVVTVIGLTGSPGTGAASPPAVGQTSGSVTVTVGTSVPTTVTVEKPGPTMTVDQPPVTTSAPSGLTAGDPNGTFKGVDSGVLPPGAPFAQTGTGQFHVVPGTTKSVGSGPDHRTFTVEVEDGIESAAADKVFADTVDSILSDSRSWVGGGRFALQRVDSGKPDFRITLTSQMTVRSPQNCGWQIQLEASCYNRIDGRVFINDARWVRGSVPYNGDLQLYRVYAINHEVGHALGYHHEPCPANGGLAPVMMQQSWSTSDDDLAKLNPGGPVKADGKTCKANPFPYPRGPEHPGTSTGSPTGASGSATGTSGSATTATG